jgi:uncharacterized RDD family membrane protein YckC
MYYAINGQRQGPIAQVEFERLVSTGVITDQTLVWKEGMADWKPYGEVKAVMPPTVPTDAAAAGTGSFTTGPSGMAEETAVCAVSGKTFPKREMIQYEGKWVSAQHRDEFFQRIRQGVAPVDEMRYAGFWIRFVAKLIDGIIVTVIGAPFNMLCAYLLLGSANYFSPPAATGGDALMRAALYQVVSMGIGVAIGIAFNLFFLSRYQATPGKMALGLKVVRSDGAKLSNGRIIGRYFAEFVSMLVLWIGYIMAAFDDQKRALHDMICDTRVIKSRQ